MTVPPKKPLIRPKTLHIIPLGIKSKQKNQKEAQVDNPSPAHIKLARTIL
jgi:P pilus assembly chaperone PapD